MQFQWLISNLEKLLSYFEMAVVWLAQFSFLGMPHLEGLWIHSSNYLQNRDGLDMCVETLYIEQTNPYSLTCLFKFDLCWEGVCFTNLWNQNRIHNSSLLCRREKWLVYSACLKHTVPCFNIVFTVRGLFTKVILPTAVYYSFPRILVFKGICIE